MRPCAKSTAVLVLAAAIAAVPALAASDDVTAVVQTRLSSVRSDGYTEDYPTNDKSWTEAQADKNGAELLVGDTSEEKRCTKRYSTLVEAQGACLKDGHCSMVTQDAGMCNKKYELRKGALNFFEGHTSYGKSSGYQERSDRSGAVPYGGTTEAERCVYRYQTLAEAKAECEGLTDCTAVTKDEGQCGVKAFELRKGSLQDYPGENYKTWSLDRNVGMPSVSADPLSISEPVNVGGSCIYKPRKLTTPPLDTCLSDFSFSATGGGATTLGLTPELGGDDIFWANHEAIGCAEFTLAHKSYVSIRYSRESQWSSDCPVRVFENPTRVSSTSVTGTLLDEISSREPGNAYKTYVSRKEFPAGTKIAICEGDGSSSNYCAAHLDWIKVGRQHAQQSTYTCGYDPALYYGQLNLKKDKCLSDAKLTGDTETTAQTTASGGNYFDNDGGNHVSLWGGGDKRGCLEFTLRDQGYFQTRYGSDLRRAGKTCPVSVYSNFVRTSLTEISGTVVDAITESEVNNVHDFTSEIYPAGTKFGICESDASDCGVQVHYVKVRLTGEQTSHVNKNSCAYFPREGTIGGSMLVPNDHHCSRAHVYTADGTATAATNYGPFSTELNAGGTSKGCLEFTFSKVQAFSVHYRREAHWDSWGSCPIDIYADGTKIHESADGNDWQTFTTSAVYQALTKMSICSGDGTRACGMHVDWVRMFQPNLGARLVGDPHVQNVAGETFNIIKVGTHNLIQIPRGEEPRKQLVVSGKIERVGRVCNLMYIRQLAMAGVLLESDYEFRANPKYDGSIDAARFFYRKGNFTTSDPLEFAQVTRGSELAMESNKAKTSVKATLHVGPAQLKVDFNMNGAFDHFDFNVVNLGQLAEDQKDIGGLLGTDDHTWATSDDDCGSSQEVRSLFKTEDVAKEDAPSTMSASM